MTTAQPPITVSIAISREAALKLVALAGLEPDERGRYGGRYWQLDEAAAVAVEEIAANDLGR